RRANHAARRGGRGRSSANSFGQSWARHEPSTSDLPGGNGASLALRVDRGVGRRLEAGGTVARVAAVRGSRRSNGIRPGAAHARNGLFLKSDPTLGAEGSRIRQKTRRVRIWLCVVLVRALRGRGMAVGTGNEDQRAEL